MPEVWTQCQYSYRAQHVLMAHISLQVLLPSRFADSLPDDLPGQSNCGESAFSYFGAETPQTEAGSTNSPDSTACTGFWTGGNAATSGISLGQGPTRRNSSLTSAIAQQTTVNGGSSMRRTAEWTSSPMQQQMAGVLRAPPLSNKGVLNEVVCGTLMLAYERAGLWEEVITPHLKPYSFSSASVFKYCTSHHPPLASTRSVVM